MKQYLWIIGGLIGMSIADVIWKNSKTYKKHQEEMRRSEEETKKQIDKMVSDFNSQLKKEAGLD